MQYILFFINYFFMIFDHFSLLGVYCAESSDISRIDDSLKDLTIKNQNITPETTIKVEVDESKIKMEEREDDKFILEESKRALIFFSEPLPPNSEDSKVFFINIEIKISAYLTKFNSILNSLIPNTLESWNRINNLNKEVQTKINEITEKYKQFEMITLPKVEDFIKRKSEFYSNYNLTIIILRTKVKACRLSFENFRNKIKEIMPQLTPSVLDFIADYGCDLYMANLEKEATFLIINLTNVQLTLAKDLKEAESLLFVLSKLLTMTPEEFLADNEVEKVLSSLD
ncbi:hypothetical protein NBO_369g0006 [Nosema bombycis CQ1]|uniref:Uncharacterized protein n=1 Tax=Nosema bombycis (strain CQ1 / CVCC 102059) TaxID=578461 RepID=R0M416_NOSB1|nr:hypothetical protein NBO_369g0006 [Nosema bombycis CQ1]|eukprot:EOB12764.1 hypothetical protein NBO_369g0006 [Nosema bombycis CQ1]